MEEQNPFPRHSRSLALKPPLPPEVISGSEGNHDLSNQVQFVPLVKHHLSINQS